MSAPSLTAEPVEITLRIDPGNLAMLLCEEVPAAYVGLEDNGDGTYTLTAQVPLGDEAVRNGVNRNPAATWNTLADAQKAELARKWERTPGAWGRAVQLALRDVRQGQRDGTDPLMDDPFGPLPRADERSTDAA